MSVLWRTHSTQGSTDFVESPGMEFLESPGMERVTSQWPSVECQTVALLKYWPGFKACKITSSGATAVVDGRRRWREAEVVSAITDFMSNHSGTAYVTLGVSSYDWTGGFRGNGLVMTDDCTFEWGGTSGTPLTFNWTVGNGGDSLMPNLPLHAVIAGSYNDFHLAATLDDPGLVSEDGEVDWLEQSYENGDWAAPIANRYGVKFTREVTLSSEYTLSAVLSEVTDGLDAYAWPSYMGEDAGSGNYYWSGLSGIQFDECVRPTSDADSSGFERDSAPFPTYAGGPDPTNHTHSGMYPPSIGGWFTDHDSKKGGNAWEWVSWWPVPVATYSFGQAGPSSGWRWNKGDGVAFSGSADDAVSGWRTRFRSGSSVSYWFMVADEKFALDWVSSPSNVWAWFDNYQYLSSGMAGVGEIVEIPFPGEGRLDWNGVADSVDGVSADPISAGSRVFVIFDESPDAFATRTGLTIADIP